MTSMTDTMTGSSWCEKYGVTFDWSANGYQVEDGWEHHAYTITLEKDGETVSLPWRQGLAIDDVPTPDAVLWAVARDTEYGALDWDDFCSEFGLDVDEAPVREYRTWEATQKMNRDMYRFMTSEAMWDDFHKIQESDED